MATASRDLTAVLSVLENISLPMRAIEKNLEQSFSALAPIEKKAACVVALFDQMDQSSQQLLATYQLISMLDLYEQQPLQTSLSLMSAMNQESAEAKHGIIALSDYMGNLGDVMRDVYEDSGLEKLEESLEQTGASVKLIALNAKQQFGALSKNLSDGTKEFKRLQSVAKESGQKVKNPWAAAYKAPTKEVLDTISIFGLMTGDVHNNVESMVGALGQISERYSAIGGPGAQALEGAVEAMQRFSNGLGSVGKAMASTSDVAKGFIKVKRDFVSFSTVFFAKAKSATLALKAFAKVNPFAGFMMWAVIIGIIVLIVVAIIKNWDKIKAYMSKIIGPLMGPLKRFFEGAKALFFAIGDYFVRMFNTLAPYVVGFFKFLGKVFVDAFKFIVAVGQRLKPMIVIFFKVVVLLIKFVVDIWKIAFGLMFKFFKMIWGYLAPIVKFFVKMFVGYIKIVGWVWKSIFSGIFKFFKMIWGFLAPIVKFFVKVFVGYIKLVVKAWRLYFTIIFNVFKLIVKGIVTLAVGIFHAFMSVVTWINQYVIEPMIKFFARLWQMIANGALWLVNTIKSVFNTVWAWLKKWVIDPIAKGFTWLWNTVKNAWDTTWQALQDLFSLMWTWLDENIIQPIANLFSGLWEGVVGAWEVAWGLLQEAFTTVAKWVDVNVIEPIRKAFSKLFDGIAGLFGKQKDEIEAGLKDLAVDNNISQTHASTAHITGGITVGSLDGTPFETFTHPQSSVPILSTLNRGRA